MELLVLFFDFVDSIETKVIKRLFNLLLPIINLALWAIFQVVVKSLNQMAKSFSSFKNNP